MIRKNRGAHLFAAVLVFSCVFPMHGRASVMDKEAVLALRVDAKLKPLYMTPGLKEFLQITDAQRDFFQALSQKTGMSVELLKAVLLATYHDEAVAKQKRVEEEKRKAQKKLRPRKKHARPSVIRNTAPENEPIAFLKPLHSDAFIQNTAQKISSRYAPFLFTLLREDAALLAYFSGKENIQKYMQSGFRYASLYPDIPELVKERYLTQEHEHAVYRILAAQQIVALYDESAENFSLMQFVYARFRAEAVWYYVQGLKSYDTVHEIKNAVKANALVTLEKLPLEAGISFHKEIGQLLKDAPELRYLYKSAKPETLGFLLYLVDAMREKTKNKNFTLVMTSMIRDVAYQSALTKVNRYTAKDVSLHTTGYAMDIDRGETLKTGADRKLFRQLLTQLSMQGEIYFQYESNGCAHICLNPKAAKKYEAFLTKKLSQEGLLWNIAFSAAQD